MPFPYYRRLSRRHKAVYRASDRIAEVPLPDRRALLPLVREVREALADDDRGATERACQVLVRELLRQLETEPASVRVLSVRPSDAESELHGLYVSEEGKRPVISVWMRTAARRRVVSFRTFLRTLFHEVGHHLDYALFDLEESFHTEGFFRRESSLMRQLAPAPRPRKKPTQAVHAAARPARRPKTARRSENKQLELPI